MPPWLGGHAEIQGPALKMEFPRVRFSTVTAGFCCRFANEEQLSESETCVMEFNKKESTYSLTLSGDVKGKQGKVKVVAKNNGGEAMSEAQLVISGRSPEFIEKPIKCIVLEGTGSADPVIVYCCCKKVKVARTRLQSVRFRS